MDNIWVRVPLEGRCDDQPEPCEDLVHVAGNLHFSGHLTEVDNGEVTAEIDHALSPIFRCADLAG